MSDNLLPPASITYRWDWDAPYYGPECHTYSTPRQRAHADHIEVTILPGEDKPMIKVEGFIINSKGERDRRYSYPHLCRPDTIGDAVWDAIGEVVGHHFQANNGDSRV